MFAWNQNGNSLVQVMMGVAIMGTVMAAMNSYLENSQRATKALHQKLEILQVQQDLMRDLSDAGICGCNFDPAKNTANGQPLTFNTNDPKAVIKLKSLYTTCVNNVPGGETLKAGEKLPGTGSGLTISEMTLTKLTPTGTGRFRGELQVNFDKNNLILGRKPATATVIVKADVSNPSQAKIVGCSTATSAVGGASSGDLVCPEQPAKSPFMSSAPVDLPAAAIGTTFIYRYFGSCAIGRCLSQTVGIPAADHSDVYYFSCQPSQVDPTNVEWVAGHKAAIPYSSSNADGNGF